MVIESNFLAVDDKFFVPFRAKLLLKITGQNRIFSPLRIEAKLIENLLPLGLEDDEFNFNNIINNPGKIL